MKVAIIPPSNNRGGPQRLAAIAAADLARQGRKPTIFVPRLPYSYYFLRLNPRPRQWLSLVAPYAMAWCRGEPYAFDNLLKVPSNSGGGIEMVNVARRPSRRVLQGFDRAIVMTIAQVEELSHLFPQEKTVYYVLHPEEMAHGHHAVFEGIRRDFRGRILALSPWTARQLRDSLGTEPPVVPAAIDFPNWEQKQIVGEKTADILFHYSVAANKGGELGLELLTRVRQSLPDTSVTLWTRDELPDFPAQRVVRNVSDEGLRELYLAHKLLLYPSTWEGFGMPPIEALACGCVPIILGDVGGAELYARNGENCVFIEEMLDTTVDRIVELLRDESRLAAFRAAGMASLGPFDPNGFGMRLLGETLERPQ